MEISGHDIRSAEEEGTETTAEKKEEKKWKEKEGMMLRRKVLDKMETVV